jgi:hypothetical protein
MQPGDRFDYILDPRSTAAFDAMDIRITVSSVPVPSTGLLAVLACGVIWCWKRTFPRAIPRGVLRNEAGI